MFARIAGPDHTATMQCVEADFTILGNSRNHKLAFDGDGRPKPTVATVSAASPDISSSSKSAAG